MTLFPSVQLPGPQSYLGLNQLHVLLFFFFPFHCWFQTLKIFTSVSPKCTQSRHILHFVSPVAIYLHKRPGYSCWPWKVSGGTEQESGIGFSGLVSVVWVCCSVFMHAANVGHTRHYSGNLRRPVVSILELLLTVQTLWTPDSFICNHAPTFMSFCTSC